MLDRLPIELWHMKILSPSNFTYSELERLRGVSREMKTYVEKRFREAANQMSVHLEAVKKEVNECTSIELHYTKREHPFTGWTAKQILTADLAKLDDTLAIFWRYKNTQATYGINFYCGLHVDTFEAALGVVRHQLAAIVDIEADLHEAGQITTAAGGKKSLVKTSERRLRQQPGREVGDDEKRVAAFLDWVETHESANTAVFNLLGRDAERIGYNVHHDAGGSGSHGLRKWRSGRVGGGNALIKTIQMDVLARREYGIGVYDKKWTRIGPWGPILAQCLEKRKSERTRGGGGGVAKRGKVCVKSKTKSV